MIITNICLAKKYYRETGFMISALSPLLFTEWKPGQAYYKHLQPYTS